jgi:threonine/homoserine/homoserine lactone efflux protein
MASSFRIDRVWLPQFEMLNFITQGITIGFSAGAMPGPFTSYIINSTLTQGWARSIVIVLVPLVTDIPIVILAVVILRQFPPEFIRFIQIAGGLYLLWLTYGAWKQFRAGIHFNPPATSQGRTFVQGLVMGWLSPGPYLFWATINGPLLVQALNQSLTTALGFLAGFYGTFIGILTLYVFVFDRLRRLDERVTRAIFLITMVVLGLFGLSLIWQGLSGSAS